jgi:hypothetical protein
VFSVKAKIFSNRPNVVQKNFVLFADAKQYFMELDKNERFIWVGLYETSSRIAGRDGRNHYYSKRYAELTLALKQETGGSLLLVLPTIKMEAK